MRIVAGTPLGCSIRSIWHCEQCREVVCEWVDLDTRKYKELFTTASGEHSRTVQARNIVFDEQALVIYINPHDLEERPRVVYDNVIVVPEKEDLVV